MAFCTNCGHQLAEGAKFCFECGAKVDAINAVQTEQRKTVYDGEIHKCPNCGDILDAYESVCETCGYERRGGKATSSVQELSRKLQEIEAQRPARKISSVFKQAWARGQISETDAQKIELIKNYPIPNSKEDILEFAVWASSNIDVDAFSTMSNATNLNDASKQAISNAWMSKFEQAYQKGKLMFGDSPELANLHSLYAAKKRSIGIKKNGIWILLAIVYGVIGLIIGIIALAGGFSTNVDEASTGKPSYGESSQTTVGTLAEIPDEFIAGYEKAEFEKYNSPASENGLGGTKIYIAGRLIRTEVLNAEGTKTILGYVSDKDDNVWLIKMHVIPIVSEDHFASAVGKTVVCTVIYDGYSGVKEMPSTTLNELLIIETGTVIYGMQKLLD